MSFDATIRVAPPELLKKGFSAKPSRPTGSAIPPKSGVPLPLVQVGPPMPTSHCTARPRSVGKT